jgi:dTDP-4-amino-4,6-dideoxy-D-galactose acyltransferase
VTSRAAAAAETCELLHWDTEHFGIRVARVRAQRLDPTSVDEVLAWAASHEIACLYLLADSSHPETLQLAASRGFRFVDVRLTLARGLDDPPPDPAAPGIILRPAVTEDEAALVALAAASHGDTRFYADGRFDPAAVESLYRTWMRGSLDGRMADFVLVAEATGQPLGYISGRTSREETLGSIELVGVSPPGRRLGVGRALVNAALGHFYRAGLSGTSVVTQGRNVAAQRLYQAGGFRTELVQLWYHRWADECSDRGGRPRG